MRAFIPDSGKPDEVFYFAKDVEKLVSLLRQYRQVHEQGGHNSAGGHLCSICEDTDKALGARQ